MLHSVVGYGRKLQNRAGLADQTFSPYLSWTEDRMGVSQRTGCREIVLCIPPVLRDFGGLWKTCAKSWVFPYNPFTINELHSWACSGKSPPAAARRGKLDRVLLQALTCTTLQRPEKLASDRSRTVTIPGSASH